MRTQDSLQILYGRAILLVQSNHYKDPSLTTTPILNHMQIFIRKILNVPTNFLSIHIEKSSILL